MCLDASKEVSPRLEDYRFRYTDLMFILKHLRKGDWVAQVDLCAFYLQLPVGRKFRKYLSVKCPLTGNLLKYARLALGLSTAPAWASAVSSEVRRILIARE